MTDTLDPDRVAQETPAPGQTPALRLDGVGVNFGGIRALREVSIEVPGGAVCGLIGPNGAGKTTLFDVISGVRRPDEGRVYLEGRDVTRTSATARARLGLRRTFQRVQTFGWLTVEDNVLAAVEWEGGGGGMVADLVKSPTRGRLERVRRAQIGEVLERCGLTAVRNEPAGSLPIGVARMVELARAVAAEPRVLILDEPTSGLDERERARLGQILADGTLCRDVAVLLVEHDISFVMEHCAHIFVLNLGEVLAEGSPEVIKQDPQVRAAYLGGA